MPTKPHASKTRGLTRRLAQPVERDSVETRDDFPVVALGASAGGLEAFTKLFDALPDRNGMAFILIQHLDPEHESMMAALLSSHTSMDVLQATDGMKIEPDHAYVIPPRVYLSIENGLLHLSLPRERHGARKPLDFFLRSLAEEYGARAACVILSGTGADGSVGLKPVKESGGLVIVQDPNEAQFDGMPKNAIKTGCADYILRVSEIPAALEKYAGRVAPARTPIGSAPGSPVQSKLPEIVDLLRATASHDFSLYKAGTLLRRIERRMALSGTTDGDQYIELLRRDLQERETLAKDLLIHVTKFFRDPSAFDALATTIVPDLVRQKKADQALRIWAPACSTGEETYSLVILLLEEIAAAGSNIKLQVFASDVEEDVVAFARNGLYPAAIETDVPANYLARYFVKEGEDYRVTPELREAVIFTVQDLLVDPPFSRTDLVSCRNLLIYLRPEVQDKVVSLFNFALRPGGILFLGTAEKITSIAKYFEPAAEGEPIYRRLGHSRPGQVAFPIAAGDGGRSRSPQAIRPLPIRATGFGELTQKCLIEAYAPASVLVNGNCEGLYYIGPIDNYLKIAPGDANGEILAMARAGLRNKLRGAIAQAGREHGRVVVTGAQLRREDRTVGVTIDVHPVESDGGEMYLVSFLDEPQSAKSVNAVVHSDDEASQVAQLERELDAARVELQSAVRELEQANEEQKAINEEAMSVNEEFQATNEELETSKEELQSLNEELTALNNQLHETVEQQRVTASDLQNVLNSANVATIFLDGKLNIRFFTPAVKTHFNIVESDIGRPLNDLRSRSDDKNISIDAESVLADLVPISREVMSDKGTWYTRRVLPYRSIGDRIEGVVISFSDVSELKSAEHEIKAARRYAESVVETIRQPLAVLDGELRIVGANSAFYAFFSVDQVGSSGNSVDTISGLRRDGAALRAFLERIFHDEESVDGDKIALDLALEGGSRSMLITARKIVDARASERVLVTFEDVTDRKRMDEKLNAAMQLADRSNRSKSRFLAAASHDLRQPLQTLSLLRGILAKSTTDGDTLSLIAKLDEPLQVMSGMLNTLLDINQLEVGIVKPEVVVFPIGVLLARLETEFSYHTAAKELDWRLVTSSLHVRSDPRLLEQMIRNFLWNAVKYTPRGKILLGCRRRGDVLRIEVWDTGIGIPSDQLQNIFDEFHQVANAARDRNLGLGLGLAIVQRIGAMLGHAIDVRSRLGNGSVFAVEVPLAWERYGVWTSGRAPLAPPASLVPRSVMIIEDDPSVSESLLLLFKMEGHRAVVAEDALKAFELIAQDAIEPDIVIADFNLPGDFNGLQAIAKLRTALKRDLPALILTGDISTNALRQIAEERCAFLNKPASAEDLMRVVGTLLSAETQSGAKEREGTPGARVSVTRSADPADDVSVPTVFVVDDDLVQRKMMLELLTRSGHVAEAFASGEAFLDAYRPARNGCLVVDAVMQDMSGIALLQRLKAEGYDLPAIVITGFGDVPTAVSAMKAGAVDFIEKPVNPEELIASIESALDRASGAGDSAAQKGAVGSIANLTPRERAIMELVLAGHPSKNIATDLGISQRTVENHRAAIMKKTGSKSIPALVRLVLAGWGRESGD